jgi:uncharacterized coiled-coil protein SlyX
MALIIDRVWGRVARPWGFEVRVDLRDDAGTAYNEAMTFKTEPDADALNKRVAALVTQIEDRLAHPQGDPLDPKDAEIATLKADKAALWLVGDNDQKVLDALVAKYGKGATDIIAAVSTKPPKPPKG